MKFIKKWVNSASFSYSVAICTGILFYMLLQHITSIGYFFSSFFNFISPLVYGAIIAYLMNPISLFFERILSKRISKKELCEKLSIAITAVLFVVIIILLLLSFIPSLIKSTVSLVENFDSYIDAMEANVGSSLLSFQGLGLDIAGLENSIVKALERLSEIISGSGILRATQQIGSSFLNIFVSYILAIYFLIDRQKLVSRIQWLFKYFLSEKYERFAAYCARCNYILLRYIAFALLESFLVGVINSAFMTLFSMPYNGVISILVAAANLIPTFGPIVGCVIGVFILLLVRPGKALIWCIFTIVLQFIDGYILKPKLFSSSLGVSSLLILVFIILGGRVFGMVGILLSIPLAAISEFTVKEYVNVLPIRKHTAQSEDDNNK